MRNQSPNRLRAPNLIIARTVGLLKGLAEVPIAQKKVVRAPQEKIVQLLVGLLSGIEY